MTIKLAEFVNGERIEAEPDSKTAEFTAEQAAAIAEAAAKLATKAPDLGQQLLHNARQSLLYSPLWDSVRMEEAQSKAAERPVSGASRPLLAKRESAWAEAEREWEALPEGEREEEAGRGPKLLDVRVELETDGLIRKLRAIRERCITGEYAAKTGLALFDKALIDFKKDMRPKYYKYWAERGTTPWNTNSPHIRYITPNQLNWIFSRIPAIDADTLAKINGIRAEIEALPEPAPDTRALAVFPDLPENKQLEMLCNDKDNALRKWVGGKYKCMSLETFVNNYALNNGKNPTKDLINDYIVKENGKGYTKKTIVRILSISGVEKVKKAKPNRPVTTRVNKF